MLVITFQIGSERVGLDIQSVREVVPRVHLQSLSGAREWLIGVFVYRGVVVPVIDLHLLTGNGACPSHLSSRIILVQHEDINGNGERLIGLLASQVADLRELHVNPSALMTSVDPSATGLGIAIADGTGILRLMDPNRLLPPGELMTSWLRPITVGNSA